MAEKRTRYNELLDVPNGIRDPDLYQLLGLDRSAPLDEPRLEEAYRERMSKLQAIRSPKHKSFIEYLKGELRRARTTLADQKKRAEYDGEVLEERRTQLTMILDVVLSDGVLRPQEEERIQTVAGEVGLLPAETQRILEEELKARGARRASASEVAAVEAPAPAAPPPPPASRAAGPATRRPPPRQPPGRAPTPAPAAAPSAGPFPGMFPAPAGAGPFPAAPGPFPGPGPFPAAPGSFPAPGPFPAAPGAVPFPGYAPPGAFPGAPYALPPGYPIPPGYALPPGYAPPPGYGVPYGYPPGYAPGPAPAPAPAPAPTPTPAPAPAAPPPAAVAWQAPPPLAPSGSQGGWSPPPAVSGGPRPAAPPEDDVVEAELVAAPAPAPARPSAPARGAPPTARRGPAPPPAARPAPPSSGWGKAAVARPAGVCTACLAEVQERELGPGGKAEKLPDGRIHCTSCREQLAAGLLCPACYTRITRAEMKDKLVTIKAQRAYHLRCVK